jgi:hypothetical protein
VEFQPALTNHLLFFWARSAGVDGDHRRSLRSQSVAHARQIVKP